MKIKHDLKILGEANKMCHSSTKNQENDSPHTYIHFPIKSRKSLEYSLTDQLLIRLCKSR